MKLQKQSMKQWNNKKLYKNSLAMKEKPNMPKAYTFWAILTSIAVSLPVGIIGIYYSIRVNSRYQKGDYDGALNASRRAKSFSLYFLILAFLVGMIYSIISGEAVQPMREGFNATQ